MFRFLASSLFFPLSFARAHIGGSTKVKDYYSATLGHCLFIIARANVVRAPLHPAFCNILLDGAALTYLSWTSQTCIEGSNYKCLQFQLLVIFSDQAIENKHKNLKNFYRREKSGLQTYLVFQKRIV